MTDETFDTTPEETTVDPTLGTQEPIEDAEETVTETVALAPDGSVEVIERDGGTAVSAAFRVAAGLDDQPE